MLANTTSIAVLAVVFLKIVLANPVALAFFAAVATVLMNALLAVTTLRTAHFVVNALASPSAFRAVPLVFTVRAISWHWLAWDHGSPRGCLDEFEGHGSLFYAARK